MEKNCNPNKITRIYECEDSIDGIFTAIYLAWKDGTSHTDVRIKNSCTNLSLFEDIINVAVDSELSGKVADSIRKQLSEDIFYAIYKASLSYCDDKASVIYHYLQKAFRIGPSIVNYLHDDTVMRIFEFGRQVGTESHKYLEFVRFEELSNGILASRIDPKSNVIPIIASHFADRLHNENWIILDTNRQLAAIYQAGLGYVLSYGISETQLLSFSEISYKEQQFQDLWSCFFNTIAIKPRINYDLQRNMMPLRYRTYMKAERR